MLFTKFKKIFFEKEDLLILFCNVVLANLLWSGPQAKFATNMSDAETVSSVW